MTADLVAFLRGRLSEDEQIARAAIPGPWQVEYDADAFGDVGPDWTVVALHTAPPGAESTGEDPAHIARWNPARALAEVEAKRQIIDKIVPSLEAAITEVVVEFGYDWPQPGSEALLRLLALPYADHPDYRVEEWAP